MNIKSEKRVCDCNLQTQRLSLPNGEELQRISKLYKVLGEKKRLQIVFALSNKSMCVHELIKLLGVEQSLVSHQLKILRDIKIVKTERRKNEIVYSLNDHHIVELLTIAKEHVLEEL